MEKKLTRSKLKRFSRNSKKYTMFSKCKTKKKRNQKINLEIFVNVTKEENQKAKCNFLTL